MVSSQLHSEVLVMSVSNGMMDQTACRNSKITEALRANLDVPGLAVGC